MCIRKERLGPFPCDRTKLERLDGDCLPSRLDATGQRGENGLGRGEGGSRCAEKGYSGLVETSRKLATLRKLMSQTQSTLRRL
ncbi:unnamed protein product [Allacma fusca]|uniref:Uncharacterized protein n=1 Tax=Allacma fusca TaxID=39272 RepID=A0A8J2KC61_9HEXA|nr:unnamed protein product [Allacma fusca]